MNISSVDLRLLVVFDAVMTERNVSRAAQRIGLSQPAVSNALKRLRFLLQDQLFIRTSNGVRPTPYALRLASPIGTSLRQIQSAVAPSKFLPQDAAWSFRMAFSEHTSVLILPRLLAHLARVAPNVKLSVQPKRNNLLLGKLDAGEIDMAIGVIPPLPKRIAQYTLFEDQYVCLMRHDHPLAGKPISKKAFLSASHLAIKPSLELGAEIDHRLKKVSATRSVILNATQYLAVPEIIGESDLIACVQKSLTAYFHLNEIYVSPLPFKIGTVKIVLAWNKAQTQHAANTWIRKQLIQICEDL